MSEWTVTLSDTNGRDLVTDLMIIPETISWGQGGPLMAVLQVMGDAEMRWEIRHWLGFSVTIYSPLAEAIWRGVVSECRIAQGNDQTVYSLEGMANRVAVAFTTRDGRQTTTWAEDARSVARYGPKEKLYSHADMSASLAEAERDAILNRSAWPIAEHRSGGRQTTLLCAGRWKTLDWLRYTDDTGRIVVDEVTESADQLLGWALSGTDIGFTRDGNLHSGSGKLDTLAEGTVVQITGPSNAGAKTIAGSVSEQILKTYEATTISFEPQDDLMDSAGGLGFIKAGTLINVSGSVSNSGWHLSKSEKSPERVEISPGYSAAFVGEGAGPTVSISTSHSIAVSEALTNEAPGTLTSIVAHGAQVVQSFEFIGDSWTLSEVVIRAKKVGNPIDSLKVGLYEDGSLTLLDSALVLGDGLTTEMADVAFALSGYEIDAGTTYNLVISRSGSYDAENHYIIEVDEGKGYADGACQVYTGSAWVDRVPDADVPFELWGHLDTATQLRRMLASFQAQRPTWPKIFVRGETGIKSRQYRDGDMTTLAEVELLLEAGTAAGDRLRARETADGALVIDVAPQRSTVAAIKDPNGIYTDMYGQRLPAGVLPYQSWVRISGAPETDSDVSAASPVYIESIELHVPTGRVTPVTAGGQDLWNLGGVRQG